MMQSLRYIEPVLVTAAILSSGLFHGVCLWWSIKSDLDARSATRPADDRWLERNSSAERVPRRERRWFSTSA